MTKEELWSAIVRQNPALHEGGQVRMSVKGIRKMFDVVYDMAETSGMRNGVKTGGTCDMPDFLKGLFR